MARYESDIISYHRRPLPDPGIPFSSQLGRTLFEDALDAGFLECYFPLSEQFYTQLEPAFCGLGSLTMVFNALLIDPERVWKGVWRWFDENMLGECCIEHDEVKLKGITMSKVACLARCNGATVVEHYASDTDIAVFRDIVKCVCSQDSFVSALVVSYNRSALNQSGAGHFSPIGAYHPVDDMVLILDVARFKVTTHFYYLNNSMCSLNIFMR